VLEEAAEVADAIDGLDPETGTGFDELEGELGDLLFQVLLHSRIAAEEGWFELADVARAIEEKMIRRHPHVFGSVDEETDRGAGSVPVEGTHAIRAQWQEIKLAERTASGRESAMDDIPRAMPVGLLAAKVLSRASGAGLTESALAPFVAALDPDHLGDRGLAIAIEAGSAGTDIEVSVKHSVERLIAWVRALEEFAADEGVDLADLSASAVAELFDRWRLGG
jgi:uncharacterized protein YabN with tetrapyrrole methylase and pyrophosphatase domain